MKNTKGYVSVERRENGYVVLVAPMRGDYQTIFSGSKKGAVEVASALVSVGYVNAHGIELK